MAAQYDESLVSFLSGIESSARRLKYNIDGVIEKYSHSFHEDDEINVMDFSLHKDRGYIRKMKGVHKIGSSQLKSTKRMDELRLSQMGHLKVPLNPDVSMAIVREYGSHFRRSNGREDEPSDAETISSDSSGEEDEEEDTDEGCSEEDTDEDNVNEGDTEPARDNKEAIKSETVVENGCHTVRKNKMVIPRVSESQRIADTRPPVLLSNTDLNLAQKNQTFISQLPEFCQESSAAESISSSVRSMSGLSEQSPRRGSLYAPASRYPETNKTFVSAVQSPRLHTLDVSFSKHAVANGDRSFVTVPRRVTLDFSNSRHAATPQRDVSFVSVHSPRRDTLDFSNGRHAATPQRDVSFVSVQSSRRDTLDDTLNKNVGTMRDMSFVSAHSLRRGILNDTLNKNDDRRDISFVSVQSPKRGNLNDTLNKNDDSRRDIPFVSVHSPKRGNLNDTWNKNDDTRRDVSFVSVQSSRRDILDGSMNNNDDTRNDISFVSALNSRRVPSEGCVQTPTNTPNYENPSSGSHPAHKDPSSNKTFLLKRSITYNTPSQIKPVSKYSLRSHSLNKDVSRNNSNQSPRNTHHIPVDSDTPTCFEKNKTATPYYSLRSSSCSKLHKHTHDLDVSNIAQTSFDDTSSVFNLRTPTKESANASNKNKERKSTPQKCSNQNLLTGKFDLPMPCDSPGKLRKHLQNNDESFSDQIKNMKKESACDKMYRMKGPTEALKSPQTKSPPQPSGSVADSVFKSPQSIKIKRVIPTPVKNTKNNTPNCQFVTKLPETPAKNLSLVTEDSSLNRGSSFDYRLRPTRNQSFTKCCCNDKSMDRDSSINLENDDTLRNGGACMQPRSCSTFLDSTVDQSPPKQNRRSHASLNKLAIISSEENPLLNTSLTVSLKHLSIDQLTPVKNRCSRSQTNTDTQLPHTALARLCECRDCLVKSGLLVDTLSHTVQQTTQENTQNQGYNFHINTSTCRDSGGQTPHGFDQKKWKPSSNEINNPNRQILSPTLSRLKRKNSGSITSGYLTETSASLQRPQNDANTSVEDNTLAMNLTADLNGHTQHTNCAHRLCQPHSTCFKMNLQCSLQERKSGHTSCCQNNETLISEFEDSMQIRLAEAQGFNIGRKYAVAKKRLKYSELHPQRVAEPVLNNQACMCSRSTPVADHWEQSKRMLSQTKVSRVVDWVSAANKNTYSGTAARYASCPAKVPQAGFLRYPTCASHNRQVLCCCNRQPGGVSEPRCDRCNRQPESVSEPRCDRCNRQPGGVSEPRCDRCSRYSRVMPSPEQQKCGVCCQLVDPISDQSLPMRQTAFCASVARTLHCGLCSCHTNCARGESHCERVPATTPFCEHQNSGVGCQQQISGVGCQQQISGVGCQQQISGVGCQQQISGVGCQHQNSGVGCQHQNCGVGCQQQISGVGCQQQINDTNCQDNPDESVYGTRHNQQGSDSLNLRAKAVWHEIQSNEHDNTPMIDTYQKDTVPDSLSSSYQSDYCSSTSSSTKKTQKIPPPLTITRNSHTRAPIISSFLKSCPNKSPDSPTSFVAANTPRLKFGPAKPTSLKSSPTIASKDSVMFPDTYIEQFSPLNPVRIDSDNYRSTFVTNNVQFLEDGFRNSEPKRQCQKLSTNFNSNNSKVNSKQFQLPRVPSQKTPLRPPKNALTVSPSPMNVTFSGGFKSPPSKYNGQNSQAARPNSCYAKQDLEKSDIGSNIFQLRSGTIYMTDIRASTPVRIQSKKSDFILNESISTIGNLENTCVNEVDNKDSSDSDREDESQNLDSSESIDLL